MTQCIELKSKLKFISKEYAEFSNLSQHKTNTWSASKFNCNN